MNKVYNQPVDLHCHSTASDGILKPEALVSRAAEQGVTTLALTDHDTLAGLEEAQLSAKRHTIQLINGIELSCLWSGRCIHIVGLQVCTQAMAEAVAEQEYNRRVRAEKIAERLAKCGFEGALQGARAVASSNENSGETFDRRLDENLGETSTVLLGRPHFAQWMVAQGHVRDFKTAFKKYLGAGKPGDVKQNWPDLAVAVQWILDAGGFAVMAHPSHYKLTRTKLKALLTDFKAAGGQGMEVCNGAQDINTSRDLARLCREFEFLASAGSDFHNPESPWQELGSYSSFPADVTPIWEHF